MYKPIKNRPSILARTLKPTSKLASESLLRVKKQKELTNINVNIGSVNTDNDDLNNVRLSDVNNSANKAIEKLL